jgi:hypothetical protein
MKGSNRIVEGENSFSGPSFITKATMEANQATMEANQAISLGLFSYPGSPTELT